MSVFKYLKHFTEKEKWGDPLYMNGLLLLLLDKVRDLYGKTFIVHCGFETSGHVSKSQHYLGNAVDFHIVDDLPFYRQVEKIEQILDELQVEDKVGLGIYPDWTHPGFHLDVRGSKARWGRIGSKYVSFEEALEYVKQKERR